MTFQRQVPIFGIFSAESRFSEKYKIFDFLTFEIKTFSTLFCTKSQFPVPKIALNVELPGFQRKIILFEIAIGRQRIQRIKDKISTYYHLPLQLYQEGPYLVSRENSPKDPSNILYLSRVKMASLYLLPVPNDSHFKRDTFLGLPV